MPLAQHIAQLRTAKRAPLIVGIQGPQGAGKTTLTLLLQRVLEDVCGHLVATLSIDDLYLTRAERAALAPRFDKARDDRLPESAWPRLDGPSDVVLFEGLWIGIPPLDDASLRVPINELEATEDPDGVWRGYANRALAERYPALFARCDLLVHVQVPDLDCVKRWRSGAERALEARLAARGEDTSRLMEQAGLARFFDHYERFSRHAMAHTPSSADVVLQLDREHRVVACSLTR